MTSVLTILLYTTHVLVSLFLILVVLLQQGKGADLAVFGGGASQAAFGARGAASVLHKATVVCFILFLVTTLSIGFMQTRSGGFLSEGDVPQTSTATEESTPADATGGTEGTTGDTTAGDAAGAAAEDAAGDSAPGDVIPAEASPTDGNQ